MNKLAEPWPLPSRLGDGTWTHLDAGGTPVHPGRYRAVSAFQEGFAVAQRFDGTAVLIDISGRELSTRGRQFRWILPFHDGVAPACTTDDEHGRLDRSGGFTPDESEEWRVRRELTRIAHLIYERGYNVSIDGNLSWRLDDGTLLMTPSGSHNGFLRPEDLVVTDLEGNLLRGGRRPTSEFRLHVELHKKRPDCRCVIHVHAPHAIAASLANVDLARAYVTVAPVPTTAYARISSEESPEVVRPFMSDYNWAILPRHGVVAWAPEIWDAFLRVEGLEHYAKVLMLARACGPVEPLPEDRRIELLTFWGLDHLGAS